MSTTFTRKEYKKLSKEEIQEALSLKQSGMSVSSIASKLNASERQVHRIIKAHANGTLEKRENKAKDDI